MTRADVVPGQHFLNLRRLFEQGEHVAHHRSTAEPDSFRNLILSQVERRVDQPLETPSSLQRIHVLALLVLDQRSNRGVQVGELVDDGWDGLPSEQLGGVMQVIAAGESLNRAESAAGSRRSVDRRPTLRPRRRSPATLPTRASRFALNVCRPGGKRNAVRDSVQTSSSRSSG